MDLLAPFNWLGDMLYPNVCAVCHTGLINGEEGICIHCITKLPKTHFGFQSHNPVEKLFWGRIPIDFAGAFLYFYHKGMARDILHQMKYHGAKDLAYLMGTLYGADLKAVNTLDFELLIPVPLHPRKFRQRGYNQSEAFALGLGHALNIEVRTDLIIRNTYSTSQTRKNRFNRWQNVEGIFSTKHQIDVTNKKIALVDDVITTGATLEAMANAIIQAKPLKLGIISLAMAKN
jgi:ComF family protein